MKKQSTSALSYLRKNFLDIAVFTIFPALILGYCRQDAKRADFYVQMLQNNIPTESYMKLLVKNFTVVGVNDTIWYLIVGILLSIVAFSFVLARVNRHMQLGVSSIRGIGRLASFNVMRVGIFVLFFVAVDIILNLLVIGLMYFVTMLPLSIWIDIVTIVMFSSTRLVLGYIICVMCCALPAVVEEGYKLNIATSYSVRIIARDKKFVWNFIFSYLLSHLVVLVLCGLFDIWYVQSIICGFYYFAWMSLIVPLFCAKYVSISNGERKDIAKSIFSKS